jgi:excisionase family DNA binding protein
VSDRYLVVLGNRLLCLSREAFEAGLREGAAVAGTIFPGDAAAAAAQPQEAVGSGLLSAEAAAAMLSVDAQCLLRQAREGRIPHVRLGRYVRFDPAAIAAYCACLPRPPATATSATAFGRRTRTVEIRR